MCRTKSGFELGLRPMTLPAARQHPLPVTEIVGGKLHGMPLKTPKLSQPPVPLKGATHLASCDRMSVAGGSGHTYPEARACRRGDRVEINFAAPRYVAFGTKSDKNFSTLST